MLEKMDRVVVKLALVMLVVILAGVPAAAWGYQRHEVTQYPPGARVFTLTAVASLGEWTLANVDGLNYWRTDIPRLNQLTVKKGDLVVLRLMSADVQHGFAIPDLGINVLRTTGTIRAGHLTTVEFRADKAGTFTFLCNWKCSPAHAAMFGELVVTP